MIITSTISTENSAEDIIIFRPLIPITLALIAGIVLAGQWPGYVWPVTGIVFILAVGLIYWRIKQQFILITGLVFMAAVGYVSLQPWLAPQLPPNHISYFADQGKWRIHGVVADRPLYKHKRMQFILNVKKLTKTSRKIAVCGRLQVTVGGRAPDLTQGDRVSFPGRLRAIRNFGNPGGFDYERHMMLRKIQTRVYTRGERLTRMVPASQNSLQIWIDTLRLKAAAHIDEALHGFESHQVSDVLKALLLGDRSGITPQLRQEFSRAGAAHVLAISGLHIGMVAFAAFALLFRGLGFVPFIVQRGWTRHGAALLCLVPVVIYGTLAGLSPSTQRAMIMVTVFMLAFWVGRRHDWLNALATAAMIILIIHPPALFSISFQLSFAAVFTIICGFLARPLQRPDAAVSLLWRMGYRLGAFCWVSLLAILGTMPLTAHYFNQICLVGLITNLVVVPVVGMLVVPCGLLAIFGLPLSTVLSTLGIKAAAWGTALVLRIVKIAAQWPFAAVNTVTPTLFEMVLIYALIYLLLFWKKLHHHILALMLVLTLCTADVLYWTYQRFGRNDMQVTAVDVGQGSAVLMQLPGGFTALVDGGGFGDNAAFDVGARILAPLLWQKKIKTVDLLILTHPNSDHLNGLLYIAQHFNVKQIWSNHETADTMGYRQWIDIIKSRSIHHQDFKTLPRSQVHQGVRFDILAPPRDYQKRRATESWRDLNNNSMVVQTSFGQVSFLFTGDIMKHAEADLLARHTRTELTSTILFVPHHGSRTSSTSALLKAVQPKEAIICAGWQNHFGFPHAQVTQRLQDAGCRIWRTDFCGAVQIVTDGQVYKIRPFSGNSS